MGELQEVVRQVLRNEVLTGMENFRYGPQLKMHPRGETGLRQLACSGAPWSRPLER